MKPAKKIVSTLETIYTWCINSGAALSGFLIAFIMLVMSAHVLMRYFLLMPIKWAVEITEYLMVWITFLGVAWVLRENAHIRVDIISTRLKPRAQALLNAVTNSVIALVCLVLTILGIIVTYESIIRGAARVYLYTVPLWILIICIPLSCFFTCIQAIKMVREYLQPKKKEE